MVNAVVGLDSGIEIAGTDTVFKVMYSSIRLSIGGNSCCIVFVNLKGEMKNETRKDVAGVGQGTSATTPKSAGFSRRHALAGSGINQLRLNLAHVVGQQHLRLSNRGIGTSANRYPT